MPFKWYAGDETSSKDILVKRATCFNMMPYEHLSAAYYLHKIFAHDILEVINGTIDEGMKVAAEFYLWAHQPVTFLSFKMNG